MKDNYTVFAFSGYFEGYIEDTQYRYVCAKTEADAEKLIQEYSDDLVRRGFARYIWHFNPIVDVSNVIVAG